MVSNLRLNRPCPCGSGETYGECCAQKKKKRRKKKRSSGRAKASSAPASTCDLSGVDEELSQEFEAFQAAYNDFDKTFAAVYNEGVRLEEEARGDKAFGELFAYLETNPLGQQLSPGQSLLFGIYFIFRAPFDQEVRGEVIKSVRKKHGAKAVALIEQMDQARFGAWRVSEGSSLWLKVQSVDGQKTPIEKEVMALVSREDIQLEPDGIWLGWLIDIGENAALSFCIEPDPGVCDKLVGAVGRQPWGSGSDFRQRDYEDDILALAVRPDCVDVDRTEGRTFFHPLIYSHAGLAPHNIESKVVSWIESEGLDVTFEEASASARDRSRHWWMYDEPTPASMWTITAAQITEKTLGELIELLRGYRYASMPSSVRWDAPIGDKSLEAIVPTRELLAMVGLEPDAGIDHPTVRGALTFPLGILDIDPAEFRRAGFDLQWSIQQGLSWARQNTPGELVAQLEDAIISHKEAARWAGVVAKVLRSPKAKPRIHYDEIVRGVHHILPASAGELCLDELDDPGRGSWSRIERGMRADELIDTDEPVRLKDLPEDEWELLGLEGVGGATAESLISALLTFVVEWPASEGHLPATKSAAQADEAVGELSSGLDELDDLF